LYTLPPLFERKRGGIEENLILFTAEIYSLRSPSFFKERGAAAAGGEL